MRGNTTVDYQIDINKIVLVVRSTIGLWHEAGTKSSISCIGKYKYFSLAVLLSLGKLVSCVFSKHVSRWERIFASLNFSWAISLAGFCECPSPKPLSVTLLIKTRQINPPYRKTSNCRGTVARTEYANADSFR